MAEHDVASPGLPEASDDHDPNLGTRTPLDRLVGKGTRAAAWLVLLAMAISVFEVVMRYGLDSPTSWVHETVIFLVATSFALGGPAALANNRHIRVRVLYDLVGTRFRYVLDCFNDVMTFAFCLAMSYAGWVMFWRASHSPLGEWQLERSGTSWNPPFPALTKGVILFALAVMTLQALWHLYQTFFSPRPPEGGSESHDASDATPGAAADHKEPR